MTNKYGIDRSLRAITVKATTSATALPEVEPVAFFGDGPPRLDRPGAPLLGFGSADDANVDLAEAPFTHDVVRSPRRDLLVPVTEGAQRLVEGVRRVANRPTVVLCHADDADSFPIFRRGAVENFEKACRVQTSGFIRFCHGWYVPGNLTPIGLLRAICAVIPPDAVLAGETAGMVYGIRVQSPSKSFVAPRICVVRPAGKRALQRPGIHCRVMELEPEDVVETAGLRCTSPLRTLIDLVMVSTLEVATHLVERFVTAGLVGIADLQERIWRLNGRRGVRVLRHAVALADLDSESPLETAVRLRLIEAGLPRVLSQIPVWVPGRARPFRLDLGWTDAPNGSSVGVEAHSNQYHPKEGSKAQQDLRRESQISAQGWKVIIVRTEDLRGDLRTFETQIAKAIGCRPPGPVRKSWRKNRWMMRRNTWTRPIGGLWPTYDGAQEARKMVE